MAFANCRQRTQHHSQASSLINGSQWVSQLVSDKHSQWSDSGPINNFLAMAMTATLGKICTFILRCQIFVLTVEWTGKYSRISWNSRKVLREQISRLLFSLLQEKFLHLKRKLMARNSFHGKQSVFPIYFHSHAFEKSITNEIYDAWSDQLNFLKSGQPVQ